MLGVGWRGMLTSMQDATDTTTETPATDSLRKRYEQVKAKVAAAAERSGRRANSIILVAVTKYASMDQVRELVRLGQADLAESQVQNLMQRAAQLDEFVQRHRELGQSGATTLPEQVRWHMIGHLQRNKVRKAIGVIRLVHSLDSLRLAEELQTIAGRLDAENPVELLIQVNISGEKSKYGVAPATARHLVEQIDTMLALRPRGLMCMAPLTEDPEEVRPVFERCQELFEDIRRAGVGGEKFNILSMGMTHDYEVAIECGANLVRVGSAIFKEDGEPYGPQNRK